MGSYLARRLLLFIPTMIFISLIIFLLLRVVPGNAIDVLISQQQDFQMTNEQRQILKQEMGLDKPVYEQYWLWLKGAVRFDFGHSILSSRGGRTVWDTLKNNLPRTLQLALFSSVLGVSAGILFGVLAGLRQDSWLDNAIRLFAVMGIAVPSFVIAVFIYYLLIRFFDWIPPIGFSNLWDDPRESLSQLIWPTLVLALGMAAPMARLTRSQFLEVYREDYIRTARAKGLSNRVITVRHALRNSLLPVLTTAGARLAGLLGGVVIVEKVFAIPGIGTQMVGAISSRDYPTIQAICWLMALVFMVSNLMVDLAYAWVDPRIKYS